MTRSPRVPAIAAVLLPAGTPTGAARGLASLAGLVYGAVVAH